MIEDEEIPNNSTNTGKENVAAEEQQTEELKTMEKHEEDSLDTARFQYDGVLNMEVVIDRSVDTFSCGDQRDPADFGDAQSLHVMTYMTLFDVDIYLKYQILEEVTCDIVDDDLRILVVNNVGFDNFAGSKQFIESITDDLTKAALSHCNPQGDVQYCSPKDLESIKEGCDCPPNDAECIDDCASCLSTCDSSNCGDASSLDD